MADKAHIFLSHATEDFAAAEKLCSDLEARGLACWLAPREVLPGQEYAPGILTAIEEARAVILLLSADANASSFVAAEIERAYSLDRPVLVARLADIKPGRRIALFVSAKQWADLFREWDRTVDRLAVVIERLPERTTAEAPPPLEMREYSFPQYLRDLAATSQTGRRASGTASELMFDVEATRAFSDQIPSFVAIRRLVTKAWAVCGVVLLAFGAGVIGTSIYRDEPQIKAQRKLDNAQIALERQTESCWAVETSIMVDRFRPLHSTPPHPNVDDLATDLEQALVGLPNVKVLSMQAADRGVPGHVIAGERACEIEGEYRYTPDRSAITLTVKLITHGQHVVWSRSYTRAPDRLRETVEDILSGILEKMSVRIRRDEHSSTGWGSVLESLSG